MRSACRPSQTTMSASATTCLPYQNASTKAGQNSPPSPSNHRAVIQIIFPPVLLQHLQPPFRLPVLRNQQSNPLILPLDQTTLTLAPRRLNCAVHCRRKPRIRQGHVSPLQRAAIAFMSNVLLDQFDIAQHGVEDVAVRVDGEVAPFESRG